MTQITSYFCRNSNSLAFHDCSILELADRSSKTVLAFRQRVTLNEKTHLLKVVARRTAKLSSVLGPGIETIYSMEIDRQKTAPMSLKMDFHVISYQNPPFIVVYLSLENISAETVAVGDIHLFEIFLTRLLQLEARLNTELDISTSIIL